MEVNSIRTVNPLFKGRDVEKEILRLNSEMQDFASHLQHISESEKREIARELHDQLGQGLTSLKFGLSWLRKHVNDDKELVDTRIEELIKEVTQTIASFRNIYASLNPAILEDAGLHASVKWMVDTFKRNTSILISYDSNIEREQMSFNRSLPIFRLVQESLTNIMRYANATKVAISLKSYKKEIRINISDNGCGFDVDAVDKVNHHGLLGMRERVYAMHGRFMISSEIGRGTSISAHIPIDLKTYYEQQ